VSRAAGRARPRAVAAICIIVPIPGAAQTATGARENPDIRTDWNPRPSFRFGDAVRIDLRLKIQGDFRTFSPDQPNDDGTFELHRRRAGVQGRVFERVEFEIERELREDGPWRDVYVNVRAAGPFEVRAGKFKMPFGLEETTSTMDLDFINRTLGSDYLAPSREVGLMAHGRVGRILEYEAGGFNGDAKTRGSRSPRSCCRANRKPIPARHSRAGSWRLRGDAPAARDRSSGSRPRRAGFPKDSTAFAADPCSAPLSFRVCT
jgi:phosphate-selective porin